MTTLVFRRILISKPCGLPDFYLHKVEDDLEINLFTSYQLLVTSTISGFCNWSATFLALQGMLQPRSQGLSSLPPLSLRRKTLVQAGHGALLNKHFPTRVRRFFVIF